jgi:hypothetical protein
MAPPKIENQSITLQLKRPRAHRLNVSPTPIATVQRRLDHFAASNHSHPPNDMDSLRRHGQAAPPASSDWLQTVKGMEECVRTGQSLRDMGEFALGEADGGLKTLGATAKGIGALVLHPVRSAKQVGQAVMASGPALTEFSRNSGPILADSVLRSAHQFATGSSLQSGNMMGAALTNTFLSLTPMPKVATLISGGSRRLARRLPKSNLAANLSPIHSKFYQLSDSFGRNTSPLRPSDQKAALNYIAQTSSIPPDHVHFVTKDYTSYLPGFDRLQIGPDLLPHTKPPVGTLGANSRVSLKGCVAHELKGHRRAAMAGKTHANPILEEAQASIRAARFGTDLSDMERTTLLRDAVARLCKNGYRYRSVKNELWINEP